MSNNTNAIWDSNQKIGIELEVYTRGGTSAVRDYISSHNMSGLEVCHDGSLGCGGAEIKFANGTPLDEAKKLVKSMHKIATDTTTLDTKFRTPRGASSRIPSNAKVPMREDYRHGGTTGLHIHFNAGEGYNPLDVLRLTKKLASRPSEVNNLAWRVSRAWGCSARTHTTGIARVLNQIVSMDTDSLSVLPMHRKRLNFNHNKYVGMNICNLSRDRKTIEFRYGDAALMTDPSAFEKYITYLKNAWDECFTGEDTMQWNRTCFLKWNGDAIRHHPSSINSYGSIYGRKIDIHSYERGRRMGDKITTAFLSL